MTAETLELPGGNDHVFPVRVYYEDTDSGGVVYYANYLRFAERARTEMLRAAGLDHVELLNRDGVVFAVRRCDAEFIKPAGLDDMLEVHTGNIELHGASLSMEQAVKRGGETLVHMKLRLACLTQSGRPARLPERVRRALQSAAGCDSSAAEKVSEDA